MVLAPSTRYYSRSQSLWLLWKKCESPREEKTGYKLIIATGFLIKWNDRL